MINKTYINQINLYLSIEEGNHINLDRHQLNSTILQAVSLTISLSIRFSHSLALYLSLSFAVYMYWYMFDVYIYVAVCMSVYLKVLV